MRSLLVLLIVALTACRDDAAPLEAADILFKRPIPGMQVSAGYLTLTNKTSGQIKLTGADSPQYRAVELHGTVIEDGVVKMTKLDELSIGPKQSIQLKPMGSHLMFKGPADDIDNVTVHFYSGPDRVLTVSEVSRR